MAKGKGLQERKKLLLTNAFKKIDSVYYKGLYNFIENKPVYNEELEKIEDRIHHLFISEYKSPDDLRKELSNYFGLHERALKAYEMIEKT